jgi:transcriptional regulator with XRE-family HTH domain
LSNFHIDGEAFKRARAKRLWSRDALANQAGVSAYALRKIESGEKIRISIVRKVILALGMTLEEALQKRFVIIVFTE